MEEAAARLIEYGPNMLPEESRNPVLVYLSYMWNPLSWAMEAAAIIAIAILDYADFALIMALLILNATISYVEEANADKAIKALTSGGSLGGGASGMTAGSRGAACSFPQAAARRRCAAQRARLRPKPPRPSRRRHASAHLPPLAARPPARPRQRWRPRPRRYAAARPSRSTQRTSSPATSSSSDSATSSPPTSRSSRRGTTGRRRPCRCALWIVGRGRGGGRGEERGGAGGPSRPGADACAAARGAVPCAAAASRDGPFSPQPSY